LDCRVSIRADGRVTGNPDGREVAQAAHDLIEREAEHHDATGWECTRMRAELGRFEDAGSVQMRELSRIRHVADARDGLRPNGRPRPRQCYLRRRGDA
jgi:hypothetical protein